MCMHVHVLASNRSSYWVVYYNRCILIYMYSSIPNSYIVLASTCGSTCQHLLHVLVGTCTKSAPTYTAVRRTYPLTLKTSSSISIWVYCSSELNLCGLRLRETCWCMALSRPRVSWSRKWQTRHLRRFCCSAQLQWTQHR